MSYVKCVQYQFLQIERTYKNIYGYALYSPESVFIPHFDRCFAKHFERSYENEHGKIQQLRHSRIYHNSSYPYQMFNTALSILGYICRTHVYIL